jgi:hypothetical protein
MKINFEEIDKIVQQFEANGYKLSQKEIDLLSLGFVTGCEKMAIEHAAVLEALRAMIMDLKVR